MHISIFYNNLHIAFYLSFWVDFLKVRLVVEIFPTEQNRSSERHHFDEDKSSYPYEEYNCFTSKNRLGTYCPYNGLLLWCAGSALKVFTESVTQKFIGAELGSGKLAIL